MAMENGHWVRWFTHKTWWIFPVRYVNVYQRVTQNIAQSFNVKSDGPSPLQVTERQETPGRGQSRPCRWENCWLGPWWTDGSDHMFTHGLGDVYGRCFFWASNGTFTEMRSDRCGDESVRHILWSGAVDVPWENRWYPKMLQCGAPQL